MRIAKRALELLGGIVLALIVLVGCFAAYNQIALRMEANEIVPAGEMVDVGGYHVHVYTEGTNDDAPTLVFLSGSATVAPVYDFKPLYE